MHNQIPYDIILEKLGGFRMNEELQMLFNEFENKIREEDMSNPDKDDPNGKYNFYIPKIRDYLIVYLNREIQEKNYSERVRLYFQEVFNRECLIEATMFYVENVKARGTSNDIEKRINAITDFLIAYNHFYEIVLKLSYTMTFFQTEDLQAEIVLRLEKKGYIMLESEEIPAMHEAEYKFILEYYNSLQPLQNRQLQALILLQLTFLYGLSLSTLKNLRRNDINMDTRTIEILSKSKKEKIVLELPYSIYSNIKTHIEDSNFQDNELFFFTRESKLGKRTHKPIASSFITDEFKTIKEKYIATQNHDEYIANRFTHYGAIKYAIANMLECNMNIASIINLTGRDTKFILSCKPKNTFTSKQQSNYINCKLRDTDTYNDFNIY